MADFPAALTGAVPGITEVKAAHLNNLEAKVGVDGSEVETSLDYLLKNPASSNPGHTHTLDKGATDVTATAAELNLLDLAEMTAGMVLRATGADSAAWEAIQAGDLPAAINVAKLADGSVANTEFECLHGVTSPIQAQLNNKQTLDTTLTALAGLVVAQGDLIYATGADAFALLNKSETANQFLKNSGASNNPAWAAIAETDLPELTAYAKLDGHSGGQTLNGGTGPGETLTFDSTAHATKGAVLMAQGGGNVGIGGSSFGTDAAKVIAVSTGTAPSTSPADAFQLYCADQAAGNACPHIRTEAGDVIKLFKGSALTTALDAITFTAPGTPDYAVQDLTNSSGYGFATKDEGNTVLAIIANLQARVNELEARLQAHGLLA